MTANQIAYAGVKVQERVADETQRHNLATEEIQRWNTSIQEDLKNAETAYKNTMANLAKEELRIKDEFNTGRLTQMEYENALTGVQALKTMNETSWIDTRNTYQNQLDEANKQLIDEKRKYSEATRDLEKIRVGIEAKKADIAEHSNYVTWNLGLMNANINAYRAHNDYIVNWYNAETQRSLGEDRNAINWFNAQTERSTLDFHKTQWNTEKWQIRANAFNQATSGWNNLFQPLRDTVKLGLDAAKSFLPFAFR